MNRSLEYARWLRQGDAREKQLAESGVIDRDTFASLYERHLADIYSYLLARTGREDDAADLAQQVFTQALAALPRYRHQGIPQSVWLFRIAHNLMVDFHRRDRASVPWENLLDADQPAAGDDVEAAVIGKADVEQLGAALARLSPDKRDLLALRFAAGLKVREIAAVLDRREAAVRSELRRLLTALQKELSNE